MENYLKSLELRRKNISSEVFGGRAPWKSAGWQMLWSSSDLELPVWFLEYSIQQNCFHVDSLAGILKSNQDIAKRGVCTGYIILEGPMVYDDAFKALKMWEFLLEQNAKSTFCKQGKKYKETA